MLPIDKAKQYLLPVHDGFGDKRHRRDCHVGQTAHMAPFMRTLSWICEKTVFRPYVHAKLNLTSETHLLISTIQMGFSNAQSPFDEAHTQ